MNSENQNSGENQERQKPLKKSRVGYVKVFHDYLPEALWFLVKKGFVFKNIFKVEPFAETLTYLVFLESKMFREVHEGEYIPLYDVQIAREVTSVTVKDVMKSVEMYTSSEVVVKEVC